MMDKTPLLDTIDPEIAESLLTRRQAIARGAKTSGLVAAGLALGSVPVALGVLTNDVYAQGPAQVLDALNFAFLLENLESEFYQAVLQQSETAAQNLAFAIVFAALSPMERATLDQIRKHEEAHVAFLRTTIQDLGGTPATFSGASFDFTGGNGSGNGPFKPATTDKAFLLAVTQGFEDTGVRAYKGQAGNVMSNNTVLEAALRIHSVEARHAAKIRKMRREAGAPEVVRRSGTIRGGGSNAAGVPGAPAPVTAALQLIYAGEENTRHGSPEVNAVTLPQIAQFGGNDAATEAFDEPLTKEQVTAIVKDFIVGPPD
ncbi:MAG: ferritin-like domain-containing protein [Gemmatimonadaceae bacterium]